MPKKHKISIDFEKEIYLRLMKVVGDAAHEGIKMPLRVVLLGAIDKLDDDELLIAAKTRLTKEDKLKN